jgi:hypothetical protein
VDLRVNIKPNKPQQQVIPTNLIKGKNVPNGLLRRATGGTEGREKSIGSLSQYRGNTTNDASQFQRNSMLDREHQEVQQP